MVTKKLSIKNTECTLDITNSTANTLMGVHLANKNIDDLSEIVENITIYRERGHICFDTLSSSVILGNLYPEETAKLSLKLRQAMSQEELSVKLNENFKLLCDISIE